MFLFLIWIRGQIRSLGMCRSVIAAKKWMVSGSGSMVTGQIIWREDATILGEC